MSQGDHGGGGSPGEKVPDRNLDGNLGSSTQGGSGGCTLNPRGDPDVTLLVMLSSMLIVLAWKRIREKNDGF